VVSLDIDGIIHIMRGLRPYAGTRSWSLDARNGPMSSGARLHLLTTFARPPPIMADHNARGRPDEGGLRATLPLLSSGSRVRVRHRFLNRFPVSPSMADAGR
jgi:hypothetical protein